MDTKVKSNSYQIWDMVSSKTNMSYKTVFWCVVSIFLVTGAGILCIVRVETWILMGLGKVLAAEAGIWSSIGYTD